MTRFAELKNPLSQALLLLLVILGIAGNFLTLNLFFGIDFIFGSIAALIAAAVFGPIWGVLVALGPGIHTYIAWGHPYAAVVLILEAAFVGIAVRRFKTSLALGGLAYWLLIGSPLVFILYRFGVGVERLDAVLVALKQGANGVINAIFASLMVTYIPWLRKQLSGRDPRIGLFETVFNIFLAAALIPAVAILTLDARRALQEAEREANAELTAISTGLSLAVTRWQEEHVRAIVFIADTVERFGLQDRALLQVLLEKHKKNWPNFYGAFVTDRQGVTIAFFPKVNAKGESTLGLSFADREYFQQAKSGGAAPHVSPVFQARGGIFDPVFNITAAIRSGEEFVGVVSGSVNLADLSEVLKTVPGNTTYLATLVDADGNVIASTRPELKPLTPYAEWVRPDREEKNSGIYHRWPQDPNLTLMPRWAASYLGTVTPVDGAGSWRLVVEVPMRPQQASLYSRYSTVLGLILVLAFVLLLTSYRVATSIARPLAQLSAETTDIPESLRLNRPIRWPASGFSEVNHLVRNFQLAMDALKRRFEDLEASRAQLDQANRTKDEFLSIASHELKTPLTPLKIQLQMIRRALARGTLEDLSPEKLLRAIETTDRQITRLTHLIEDLLDVARINSGKLKLNIEKIDLTVLAREVVERYTPQLTAARSTVTLNAPQKLEARVDPLRIEQVMANLMTNAAKYAPGKPVAVSLVEEKDFVALEIRDQGPGIPEEARERVFDRFERIVSNNTVGGLGLGLFISRQIVEAHGGSITVESEAGRGSAFTVRLPRGRTAPS